jgi:hypothetical protein
MVCHVDQVIASLISRGGNSNEDSEAVPKEDSNAEEEMTSDTFEDTDDEEEANVGGDDVRTFAALAVFCCIPCILLFRFFIMSFMLLVISL